ncbi:MAG: trigger factor [Cyclobacteriaceae bacterium]
MEIALDKINETEALIKIKLNQDDYQKSVDEKIKDYSKKANIKGFRPGKVPVGMIKKMYGTSILVDEINGMLSNKLMEYIQQSDLQILGEPVPNTEKAASIDWDNQKDFDFEYHIGFAEDFDVAIDDNLKLTLYKIDVTDEVINETIENVAKQSGETTDVEEVAEGTNIAATLVIGEEFNKEVSIEVDKLEKSGIKALKGKKADEEVTLKLDKDISVDYLSQITAGDVPADAKEGVLKINKIQTVTPAAIDEELYKKAFPNEEIENEEQFRNRVKEIISSNYDRESEFFFNQKTREQLIEKYQISLPEDFLKDWLIRNNEGLTAENIDTEFAMYADELKWSLIKGKVLKSEDIKIEPQEIIEEAKNMIRMQFAQSGFSGEEFENSLDSFASNYLQGENGENYRKIHNQVETQKVYNYIRENAAVEEKTVGLEEFRNL